MLSGLSIDNTYSHEQMDNPAALHRIKVGVPATVEHSSEAGPETGKWVAETTQVSIIPNHPPSDVNADTAEFHHVHGCATASNAREGPASSYLTRSHDKLCTF